MEPESLVSPAPQWASAPSALQSRLQHLQSKMDECRQRLQSQDQEVGEVGNAAMELQARAAHLMESLCSLTERIDALGHDLARACDPEPPPQAPAPQHIMGLDPISEDRASFEALPEIAVEEPTPEQPPRSSPGPLLKSMPYILLLTIGLGYALKGQASPAPALPSAQIPVPAPVVDAPSEAPPPAIGAAAEPTGAKPAMGDLESEALRLVYEYRLPGSQREMLDLVGSQEAALGPSPWEVTCSPEARCDVSFAPRRYPGSVPLYEFEVDLVRKTVTPSAETAEKPASPPSDIDGDS
jgi:hypothetical protein